MSTKLLTKVNVVGLVASALLFYLALSKEVWWSLTGGNGETTFHASISPFYTSITILTKPVDIPIILYLNLGAQLTILLTATLLLVGSIFPQKRWAKHMYSHRALAIVLLFAVMIYIGLRTAENYVGISMPIIGTTTLRYTISQGSTTIETATPILAGFTAQYWIALLAGFIASSAKMLHRRTTSTREKRSSLETLYRISL